MTAEETLHKIDNLERIGVIGSPSSTTELTVDILESACKKNLIGGFTIFDFDQENTKHCALGQITEIELRNMWTEDSTMKGLIRRKGSVPPVTGRQDTHTANMITSAVFKNNGGNFEQSSMGTVPETGSPIKLVTDEVLEGLLENYKKELFYIGKIYGSDPKLPTWFRHFSKGQGGLGEAYHIGIFGKTGSGKSFLSKMMMSAYAKHKNMSIFVIDPQGEFTKDCKKGEILYNVLVDKLGRKLKLYSLHNLILSGGDLFKKILSESDLLLDLFIKHPDNRLKAANAIINFFEGEKISPWKFGDKENFDKAIEFMKTENFVKATYADKGKRTEVSSAVETANQIKLFEKWTKITNLFKYKPSENVTIKDLVEGSFNEDEKEIAIIDLSNTNIPDNLLWNENIKYIVINELLERLTSKSEEAYKENKHLNSLVILDEAHKFAPRETSENDNFDKIKSTLINAVRTTRKCGLGWMFISQTLASLDKEILNQIRVFGFGFGLGWGSELDSLKQIIGGNPRALSLYQSFKDPQSGFKTKEYPFMIQGPISPLSFTSTPMFMNALDFPTEFVKINGLE
jgi:DNA helicase HerA-like ATPase